VGAAVVVIGSVGGWDAQTAVPSHSAWGRPAARSVIVPGVHRTDLAMYWCGHRRVAIYYESRRVGRGTSMWLWRHGSRATKVEGGDLLSGRGEHSFGSGCPSL